MIVSLPEIIDLIQADTPDFIKKARKKNKVLTAIVNGEDFVDLLYKASGLENKDQKKLRDQFARSIKAEINNLLRPVDKIWTAKGGSKIFTAKNNSDVAVKRLKEELSKVRFGMNMTDYLKNIHTNKYYTDPSGVVFFEWKEGETYPTSKSIQDIKNYKIDGRKVEWILFEAEKRKLEDGSIDPKQYYRFVDDAFDYIFVKEGDNIYIKEDEVYLVPEYWGKVPAIVNSEILNPCLKFAESPLDVVIDIAVSYLRGDSVKEIYKQLHGFPIFWTYLNMTQECGSCGGNGYPTGNERGECEECRGTGKTYKKDVSDGIFLKPPRDKDSPTITPNVAGYVQPDLETWQEMRAEQEWLWDAMHFAMWGTTYSPESNDTATARFLDIQPVNDRLGLFSDSYERLESEMTWFISRFYLQDIIETISINYGRRYMMESPDALLEKYAKLRDSGAPYAILTHNLTQYYQSEFQADDQTMAVMIKALKVEPFVHQTISQVLALQVNQTLLDRKKYFGEWFDQQDHYWLLTNDTDKWIISLEEYLKQNNLINETSQGLPASA